MLLVFCCRFRVGRIGSSNALTEPFLPFGVFQYGKYCWGEPITPIIYYPASISCSEDRQTHVKDDRWTFYLNDGLKSAILQGKFGWSPKVSPHSNFFSAFEISVISRVKDLTVQWFRFLERQDIYRVLFDLVDECFESVNSKLDVHVAGAKLFFRCSSGPYVMDPIHYSFSNSRTIACC